MRLIDADAFELNVQNEWERNEISNGDWILIRQLINEEPTVDAVEVVRCRDCKWFGDVGCAIMIADDTDKPTENDYCSFGGRNDEITTI